jgi:hypothetical protein
VWRGSGDAEGKDYRNLEMDGNPRCGWFDPAGSSNGVEKGDPSGHKTISEDTIDLIRTVSRANPLWGAPLIPGEFLKLNLDVPQRSVARYMIPHARRSSAVCHSANQAGMHGRHCR